VERCLRDRGTDGRELIGMTRFTEIVRIRYECWKELLMET